MISPKVMSELHQAKLVPTQFTVPKPGEHAWSPTEQRRFWEAIQRFPQGPWTAIAAYVGSKSTRQAMTHAQKLRQKLNRWKRRVRSDSVGSTCSNSSASASGTTPVDGSQTPPLSPRESGDNAMMNHIKEEEDGEQKDRDKIDCKAMAIKVEWKEEMRYFGDYLQVQDVHDDHYFEHLLSDIEPVLENVAHFTTGFHHPHGYDELSRPMTNYDTEQAVFLTTHHAYVAPSAHKTTTFSMWNQHQDPFLYQYPHQYTSTSTSAPMHNPRPEPGHQRNKIYHL